ncbi:MAG: stage III sporulation protein AE [Clostridia bacterium]
MSELLTSAIKGEIDNKTIGQKILSILFGQTQEAIRTIGIIMVIVIISSILKSISDDLENKGISQITHYITYILIVTIIMKNFSDIITMIKGSIEDLVAFSNSLLPLLITLMISTGNIASASVLQSIILFIITFIGNFINNILIPITLISVALGIISNISDRVQIDKLSKFINSAVVWVLGIVLTIFVGVSSLEGSITNGVDALTVKTTKAAVSNFIPIVGKILGDAVDTVMSCGNILKNAVGAVGVIIILGICIVPIIKLVTLMGVYYLGSALCQPIADTKIVKLLGQIGGTFKLLLAVMCSISAMLIIGVTLVIKISSSA